MYIPISLESVYFLLWNFCEKFSASHAPGICESIIFTHKYETVSETAFSLTNFHTPVWFFRGFENSDCEKCFSWWQHVQVKIPVVLCMHWGYTQVFVYLIRTNIFMFMYYFFSWTIFFCFTSLFEFISHIIFLLSLSAFLCCCFCRCCVFPSLFLFLVYYLIMKYVIAHWTVFSVFFLCVIFF